MVSLLKCQDNPSQSFGRSGASVEMDVSGMSMGGGDGSMGNMSVGNDVPSLFYLQQMFWAVIGAAIASATVVNIYNKLLWRQRLARYTPSTRIRISWRT